MTSARAEILARIAAAGATGPVPIPRDYRTATGSAGPDGADGGAAADPDRLALLVDRLEDYRAVVHRCALGAVGETVGALLAQAGVRDVVVPAGFPSAWLPAGVTPVGDEPPLPAADLDRLDGVLTGCRVAVAETGTIVLDGGPGMGRRALSLVPDVHLVVVRSDQVVGRVPEAIAQLDAVRPQTWISGPSATSDIELQRVEGVHGPRRLYVVLAD